MPPKKAQTNGSHPEKVSKAEERTQAQNNSKANDTATNTNKEAKSRNHGTTKKRKAGDSTSSSNKAPRRSARSTPSQPINQLKLLQYLLSPASLDLCRPKDETEDLKNKDANTRTYSTSSFTSFEELVYATILSRPIGHMLGLRSIRTIFNPPYELTTPKKIREAGNDGCRAALEKARTQHRQKTAEELVILADAVAETLGTGEDDLSLGRVREECGSVEEQRGMLRKNVKGLGKTGLDIFGRRIQAGWAEWFPFVDGRTMEAVEKLGLPCSAEGLREVVEKHWAELEVGDFEARDDEEKKREVFVRILERAVGADLEGKIDDVKAEAV